MYDNNNAPTRVFYDGACPLCSAEMDVLRRWDRAQRLQFIDIAAPSFHEHEWPVSCADMNALLHVRRADGVWLKGMAAVRHLYRLTGRGWMLAFTGWPVISFLFDRAYAWFARRRVRISLGLGMRRRSSNGCDTTR